MIVAGTGHRPEDCRQDEGYVRLLASNKLRLTKGVDTLISGMAAGFDLWAADEALKLGLEVWAAKPWAGHSARKEDVELYERVIAGASKVVNVNEAQEYPGAFCYHKRNEWMVDNADVVMAYWTGKESGGTYACINYAKKVSKPIANIINDPPF